MTTNPFDQYVPNHDIREGDVITVYNDNKTTRAFARDYTVVKVFQHESDGGYTYTCWTARKGDRRITVEIEGYPGDRFQNRCEASRVGSDGIYTIATIGVDRERSTVTRKPNPA